MIQKIKSIIEKNTGIKALLFFFKLSAYGLVLGVVISVFVIYINDSPSPEWNSSGFNEFTNIYRFPISLLIALFAVITLHITIKRLLQTEIQLNLLTKQIRATRQPEIFIDNINIVVVTTTTGDYINKINITKRGVLNEIPEFTIFNIGNGPAVEIKLRFDFDVVSALDLIESLNEKVKWFEISKVDENLTRIKSRESEFVLFMEEEEMDNPENINFIISYSQGTQNNYITVPEKYFELFIAYMSLVYYESAERKFVDAGDYEERIKEFPIFCLHVIYNDIGGNKTKREFQITPVFYSFSNPFYYGKFRNTENDFGLKVSLYNS